MEFQNLPLLTPFNFEVLLIPSGRAGDETLTRTASFAEVSGLEITIESREFREGGYNRGMRQLVGRTTTPTLVLKRGLTRDSGFWTWVQSCISGKFPLPYIGGQIIVHAADRADQTNIAVWGFSNGIATRVKGPDLNANSTGELAIEELHIVHEGLVREEAQ